MALNDLLQRVKQSRIGKAISSLDRDPNREGFQLIQRVVTPQENTTRNLERFGQKIRQGINRVGTAIKQDPLQFTPLSMREQAVPLAQDISRITGFQGAEDIGRFLRGGLGITPFQRPGEKLSTTSPKTEREKNIERIGRGVVGLASVAPLGGGGAGTQVARTIGRGITSTGIGAGFGAGINALIGGDVVQGLKTGAAQGLSSAPLLAITNPITEKFISQVSPSLGLAGQQLGIRSIGAAANVIEDEILGLLDNVDVTGKDRLYSAALGALMSGNSQAIDSLKKQYPEGIIQSVKNKIDQLNRPVREGINQATGERIVTPMWQYRLRQTLRDQSGFVNLSELSELPGGALRKIEPLKIQSSKSRVSRKQAEQSLVQELPQEAQKKLKTLKSQVKSGKVEVGGINDSLGVSISDKGKYSFNINKNKLQLDKEQSKQLDNIVEQARPILEGNKGETLTKKEIVTGARKADLLSTVMGRDDSKQFAESLQASRNLLRSELATPGVSPKFLEQLEIVSSHAADAGRRLQAFNIGAEDVSLKEKVLQDILKAGADADEILKAGKQVDWNDAKQVTEFYRKFKPATFADKLDEFRYTNMLSSPNTHINNAFSNLLQTAVLAPIEKTVRGGLDFARSRLTGKEQEYFASQGVDYAKGYWKSLPDAVETFKKTMSDIGTLEKPDLNMLPTNTSKARQLYTTPLRALEASDQFFRTMIKDGEIESLKKQGITGAEAIKKAEIEADYRTFRQAFDPDGKLGQNKVLQVFDKWNKSINSLRNAPGGKWLVPFLQTPTNILKQGIEYSPFGVATIKGSQEPMTQLAKTAVGTTIFGGAYALASSGLTTWDAPTNSTERSEFYAAGLQPYSVKIGDKWVSYSKLGPLAYPIAMASALKWAEDNNADEGTLKKIGAGIGGTLGFFADQSYMRGIGDIIDAFRGDEFKQARGLGNIPSQLVPYRAAMGWIARLVDPVYRKTSGGSVPEQIGKSLISQFPFASKALEAYETPFGGESQRQFPGINAFSPLGITEERPVEKEYYDARQKIRDENKRVNKILNDIEAGEKIKTNLDVENQQQIAKLTKKKIEAGLEVTNEELTAAYLQNPLSMPSGNRYTKALKDRELWSAQSRIRNDENLSPEQKDQLFNTVSKELGISRQDLEVYEVARQDNNTKTLFMLDSFDQGNPENFIRTLLIGRKPVNGQILTSDGVIKNLVDDGIISEELGRQLKNIDFNEDGTLKKRKPRGSGSSKKRNKAVNDYLSKLSKIVGSTGSSKIRTRSPIKINTKGLTFES